MDGYTPNPPQDNATVNTLRCPPPGVNTGGGDEVIYVPMINQTIRRNRIIEVPEVHVIEKLVPKITVQDVIKKVPKVEVQWVEKIVEVPQIKVINKIVEVPQIKEVVRFVPRVEIQEVVRHIPKFNIQKIQKFVEVPHVQIVEKIVEVPQIQEVIKYKEKIEVVDIPVERVRRVPKINYKIVERMHAIPGAVELLNIPQETVVTKPVVELIEKVVPEPEIQEFVVENPIPVPSSLPPVELPVEVPVYIDVPQYYPVKGKVIPVEKEKIYEKIVEVPVPVLKEKVRVVKVPREVPVEIYREVLLPKFVDKFVAVPHQVPFLKPPPVIQPVIQNQVIDEPPVYESAPPRYIYEQPVWGEPVYENPKS